MGSTVQYKAAGHRTHKTSLRVKKTIPESMPCIVAHSTRHYIGTAVGPLHPALHRNGGWAAPPGVTSERRLEGLRIHFVICCLLSVRNIFTTRRLMSIYK